MNFGVAHRIYRFYHIVTYIEGYMNMEDNKTEEFIQKPIELTAGEILRNARTTGRRKREITTIAKQLCIREEFLQALEEGNYTFIPELVYILGFARNYAMELGLNPDEIVNKIKYEMGIVSEPHSDTTSNNEKVSDIGGKSVKLEKNTGPEKKATARKKISVTTMVKGAGAFVRRNWYWFVEGLGLMLVAIIVAVVLMHGHKSDTQIAGDTPAIVTESEAEPAYRVAVRERWGTENRKNANIVLQAVRGSWIKIEDARGKTEFSRVLVEGDVYYLPIKGKYTATFGDAGGIDVWVNNQLAPKVGDDHIRKAGISLDADKLLGIATNSKSDSKTAEKSGKTDKVSSDGGGADKTE